MDLMLLWVTGPIVNPSPFFMIPVLDNFVADAWVTVQESISADNETLYVYTYTVWNHPESGQPIKRFGLPGFASPEWEAWEGKVWVHDHQPGKKISPGIPPEADTFPYPLWLGLSNHLCPGDTLSGLVFISHELPDISWWYAEDHDATLTVPIITEEAEDTLEKIFWGKTPFGPGRYGRTVSPGPFPPPYLDSMVIHLQIRNDTAFAIGWMDERAHDRLARLLQQALRWAQEERMDRYRATLERFLSTLERLHNQGHVQDKAFYVLYYRARYILNRIPFPEGPPRR